MSLATTPTTFDHAPWNNLLEGVTRRHNVPGIVAGVLRIDPDSGREQRFVAHAGWTNLRSRVPNDTATLCQVGSITKVVTATMILQLRDEGRLELDTPVRDLLPGVLAGSEHADAITVRHLLTHTSGIDGDLFTDTGRGDDCVEKYVDGLAEAEALFAPGTGWSYCNSGFVLLGRIVEVLDERTWDASLRARVSERLGLKTFFTLPEDVLGHRSAFGHIRYPGAPDYSPAPVAMITRSMGPAGLITSSVDDLLDFGGAFLRGGATGAGTELLSEDTVTEMTDQHWVLDPAAGQMSPEWGLGWMRDSWDGHRVFWHGGTTIGQNAWFQVLPDDGLALVVFCNGGSAAAAAEEVYSAFAAEFAGAVLEPLPQPTGPASEATCEDRWLGTYSDASTTVTVQHAQDGTLQARVHSKLDRTHPEGMTVALYPGDGPERFLCRLEPDQSWGQFAFTEIEGARVAYLGIRTLPKRPDSAESDAVGAVRAEDVADTGAGEEQE